MLALAQAPEVSALAAPRGMLDIEQHLQTLLDSKETVPAELEAEYGMELQAALLAAVAKRDRVSAWMAQCESMIACAHDERKRQEAREARYTRAFAFVERYVLRTIDSLGLDAKGKRRRLEGTTVTFNARGCDKRAEVVDEQAVPTKYKRVTVTLPAETWELVCDSLDLDLREQVLGEVRSAKVEVSTSMVKADLKADIAVPGARLGGGVYLERK
jgi:hypothetical protein